MTTQFLDPCFQVWHDLNRTNPKKARAFWRIWNGYPAYVEVCDWWGDCDCGERSVTKRAHLDDQGAADCWKCGEIIRFYSDCRVQHDDWVVELIQSCGG